MPVHKSARLTHLKGNFMSNNTTADVTGIFSLDTNRLVGLAAKGSPDVTYLAGQDTPTSGIPLTATLSDGVVGNIIPMIGGKYAPTQADLLRLFPLPTHRVIADPWTVNIAGAAKPAGATITVEAEDAEYGGSVIRIDLPAGVANGAITLPINPDVTGAYPKALPEMCWRLNVSDWAPLTRFYAKAGDATLANCKLWVIVDDSSGGKSQYGAWNGPHPARWNNVYRTLRSNPFAMVSSVGTMPWDENNPEAEIRAISFTVSTSAAVTIRLSRVYSPEWTRGAIVQTSDGGYQYFHDNLLPEFSSRGWPGVVSRLANTDPFYTADAQWQDFIAAGWDVCQHISQGNTANSAATTAAQVEQSLHDFKRLAQSLRINNPGNFAFSQFLANAGRYNGNDIAGILRKHGIQSSRGVCSDAEYGIDPWDTKFYSVGWAAVQPHGFIPKYGRYNRWHIDAGNGATPEARDTYAGSDLSRLVAIAAKCKSVGINYIHRAIPYDGTNPLPGNTGLNFCRDYVSDLSERFSTGSVIPLSITQLDGLTYNRPGDVYVRWDGEWVSRSTGKIVI